MTASEIPPPLKTGDSQPFLQAARHGNNAGWTYLATLSLVMVLVLAGNVVVALLLVLSNHVDDFTRLPLLETTVSLLLFGLVLVGLWIGMRFIHRRPFSTLIFPLGRFRWGLALRSGLLWFGLSGLGDLVLWRLAPQNYSLTFDLAAFLPYLGVALVLFPMQVAAEELLFRGYLMQAFGLRARRIWLPLFAPAVIFGLLHGANPEVATYGAIWLLPTYIGIGLVLGWVTLCTQGLEMSLGLHLANNLYSSLMVTFAGSVLSSPAIFSIQHFDAAAGLVVFVISAAVYLGISKWAGWLTFQF